MIKPDLSVLKQHHCLKQTLLLIAIQTAKEDTEVMERAQSLTARDMEGKVLRGMARMTEANVAMAHVVGTTVPRPQELEMRGTLVRPVATRIRIRMISVTDVEELITGPAPAVHQRKL